MTLHWNETAHDCVVIRKLKPVAAQHFTHPNSRKWEFTPSTPMQHAPGVSPPAVLAELIARWGKSLPSGSYWDRTRHRLSTWHGISQVRRQLSQAFLAGTQCLCLEPPCIHARD